MNENNKKQRVDKLKPKYSLHKAFMVFMPVMLFLSAGCASAAPSRTEVTPLTPIAPIAAPAPIAEPIITPQDVHEFFRTRDDYIAGRMMNRAQYLTSDPNVSQDQRLDEGVKAQIIMDLQQSTQINVKSLNPTISTIVFHDSVTIFQPNEHLVKFASVSYMNDKGEKTAYAIAYDRASNGGGKKAFSEITALQSLKDFDPKAPDIQVIIGKDAKGEWYVLQSYEYSKGKYDNHEYLEKQKVFDVFSKTQRIQIDLGEGKKIMIRVPEKWFMEKKYPSQRKIGQQPYNIPFQQRQPAGVIDPHALPVVV